MYLFCDTLLVQVGSKIQIWTVTVSRSGNSTERPKVRRHLSHVCKRAIETTHGATRTARRTRQCTHTWGHVCVWLCPSERLPYQCCQKQICFTAQLSFLTNVAKERTQQKLRVIMGLPGCYGIRRRRGAGPLGLFNCSDSAHAKAAVKLSCCIPK